MDGCAVLRLPMQHAALCPADKGCLPALLPCPVGFAPSPGRVCTPASLPHTARSLLPPPAGGDGVVNFWDGENKKRLHQVWPPPAPPRWAALGHTSTPRVVQVPSLAAATTQAPAAFTAPSKPPPDRGRQHASAPQAVSHCSGAAPARKPRRWQDTPPLSRRWPSTARPHSWRWLPATRMSRASGSTRQTPSLCGMWARGRCGPSSGSPRRRDAGLRTLPPNSG